MFEKLRQLFRRDQQPARLVCMRRADATVTIANQIERPCSVCGETVVVFQSGQRMLRDYPGPIEIVCQRCAVPEKGEKVAAAPGAIDEAREVLKRHRPF